MTNGTCSWTCILGVMGAMVCVASAQEAVTVRELLVAPGTTLASSPPLASKEASTAKRSTEAVGYLIEEVDLGQPRRMEMFSKEMFSKSGAVADKVWRVRVFTRNLRVRSAPAIV